MMGRSANGGCGTEEQRFLPNSRVSNSNLSSLDNSSLNTSGGSSSSSTIDLYAQACKALSIVSPFDLDDGEKSTTVNSGGVLPASLAGCLAKITDSHKRRKKPSLSHLSGSDTTKNKKNYTKEKSKGKSSIWYQTEDYFREVSVSDVERIREVVSFSNDYKFVTIPAPCTRNNVNDTNNANDVTRNKFGTNVTTYTRNNANDTNNVKDLINDTKDVKELMEVDVDVIKSEREDNNNDTKDSIVSCVPQTSSGVEWLLGSRHKFYLTSERPTKKRKLLGGDAGLEKLLVVRSVRDQGASTCCHYCSLGDTGNQLNRLIVCTRCGVAVHQRCYGVQQDDEAGCWLCSWCKLKGDGDRSSDGSCVLCPQKGGALKPVRKRGAENDDGGVVEFAHLFCCQWMSEVFIEDTNSMEPIMNVEGIKEMQKKLVCYLCKIRSGACVRCSFGTCRTSFHPICAREARQRMEIWGKFGCDDVELRAFCSKHYETQKEGTHIVGNPSVGVVSSSTILEHQPLSSVANEPLKLKLGNATFEDGLPDARSNFKTQPGSIDGAAFKGSSTLEDVKVSDSSNLILLLKKLIDRGKVNLKDVASEINVSANLLASNLADDCLPPDLHGKITKWLKNHAHVGGLQKNLKLKVISSCISKGDKECGVENAIRASENNGGNSLVKSAPIRRTKANIRMLKENSLILSLKRSSGDDGVVVDEDKNGCIIREDRNLRSEESSPDSREKILPESCLASDPSAVNTSDHKGDDVERSSPRQSGSGHVEGSVVSNGGTRVKSNLVNHECSVAMNDGPDAIRTEASPGTYVHPLILAQNQLVSEIKADEDHVCRHQVQHSTSTELSCEVVSELGQSKRKGIINMSPTDEVEGELVYYQHQLLCNAVSRKHLNDVLISKMSKRLPGEIEALRKQNWDAVLISQYLSDLREVKKQGRKERRHKEAQAVLAAATAAAAASSRLSSVRKDAIDEPTPQESTLKIKAFGGRPGLLAQQVPRPKETHPKLSVTWTSPEMKFDSLPSALENKVHSRVCDVCNRAETILNPIIVCSSCKVSVHIDCYSSVKEFTGPWFCELCEDLRSSRSRGISPLSYLENPSLVAECSLCGCTAGAFRKSTDGQWVHAFCAEWVLESTFRRGQVKPIEGTWSLTYFNYVMPQCQETVSRGNDFCLVCSRKVGVCIKCNYGHCSSTFHPTCGRRAGFLMNVRTNVGKIQHKAYCEKHSQVERTKAETQKHGVEEWNSLKKVRVELERLRLICERVIKREKLKREVVLCSQDMLHWNRESISSSMRACPAFVSPDVSSESATTSLRGYTNSYRSCSDTVQRSDDITIDSTVAGKRRIKFQVAMDNDQKTDDSSTSQILTQTPTARTILSGKQIPHRPPSSAASLSTSDDGEKCFRHGKPAETFEKELVMTSDQASMRNQRLPKGFVYVPIRCLSNEEETIAAAGPASEENSGQDE
ncbi:zinc finger, FYVE/PHD-type containing protein [Tanacetum coccineum]|uniref:Zinc finger, FYVE/PHD-type containing protein n=1 Tax=Tanacetum coccineum TaxID=301880 RepID=A0ABQ5DWQ1_9ASTR